MNTTQNGVEAQGAEPQEFTLEHIEKMAQRDLSMAINFLQAIYTDPDLLRSVATFIHGRYLNFQEAKKRQPEINFPGVRVPGKKVQRRKQKS